MKKMKTLLLLLFFVIIVQAPELAKDDVKKKTDYIFSEILRERQEKLYDKEFQKFADYLGFKESGNNHTIINSIGCFGEYQFQEQTLFELGYNVKLKAFRKDPEIFPKELQRKALKALVKVNWIRMEPYYDYVGKTINGVLITKSGLIAGCHLGGIVSVRMYLLSNGKIDKKDCNGTKISTYIKEFIGYNI